MRLFRPAHIKFLDTIATSRDSAYTVILKVAMMITKLCPVALDGDC